MMVGHLRRHTYTFRIASRDTVLVGQVSACDGRRATQRAMGLAAQAVNKEKVPFDPFNALIMVRLTEQTKDEKH
jgi:hypothetical protein